MFNIASPAVRLLLGPIGATYLLKASVLFFRQRPRTAGWLGLFLFAWPGVIPDHFRERRAAQAIEPSRFFTAWAQMVVGVTSIVLLAVFAPHIPNELLGLAGTAAILLTVHLGIGGLLPWLLRWAGFSVPLLFDRPWAACSLGEFWSRRWNLAFVEMNRRLLLKPAHRHLGRRGSRFALFVLSGLLHELGISFPAGGGYGLPLGYFVLHGVLVEVEERFRISGRAWTWSWLLAPAPWLFHAPFRHALVGPFYHGLHALIGGHTWEWHLSWAIYAAAFGNLLVLIASVQVPSRLGWKKDLARLTPFNRKIFWVYGFYILFCVVSFAFLTWRLHEAFLTGEVAARWLAGFIAVFWTIRVLIDFFWYEQRDWPAGNALVAGHALATTLFSALATVYWFTALARRL